MQIIKIGYSVFIEQILMRMGFMATALMAAHMGTQAMAAHQVDMNIMGLTFSFGDGMQVAAVALIGRSLGEGKKDKAISYGMICRKVGFIISIILAVFYFCFGKNLYRLFFEEEEIIEYGVEIIRIMIFIVFFQIAQVIYMGALRGAGDTIYTAIVSAISVSIVRIVCSYVCGFILGWGMVGIWVGTLADQAVRYLCATIRFYLGKWTNIKI